MIIVLYSCDDSYIRQTIVSMVSILRHNSQVKFYLAGDNLSVESINLLRITMERYGLKTEVQFIEAGDILPESVSIIHGRHPRTIYAKLFMEYAIPEDRVLYLDSDTVVNGSLDPLFARDMENELAAGVLMPYSSRLKKQMNIDSGQPYICDGVVLFNMELWRRLGKSEECSTYIKKCKGNPPMLSEGTLNYVCQGMVGILEPKYNLMPAMLLYTPPQIRKLFNPDCYYQDDEELVSACMSSVIIHFMNELYNRPWREPCDHPWKDLYRMICEEAFCTDPADYEKLDIPRHVKITRKLYEILPFGLFAWLYKVRHAIDHGV